MKGVLVLAALLGVVIGYLVILLIVNGVRFWIFTRYDRKQRKLNREQEKELQ